MTWDDTKIDGSSLTPTEWNAHVTDQKSRGMTTYFNARWANKVAVVGTWAIIADGSTVVQTDYDEYLPGAPGFVRNTSHTDGNEIDFGTITLNAGTYVVSIGSYKSTASGIIEIFIGATSLGTVDLYAAVAAFNQVDIVAFVPTARTTGTLRILVNGKNAASTDYYVEIARLEFVRTTG